MVTKLHQCLIFNVGKNSLNLSNKWKEMYLQSSVVSKEILMEFHLSSFTKNQGKLINNCWTQSCTKPYGEIAE